MMRKTTELLSRHFPRDIALFIESFIMTMGIHDKEFPTGFKYLNNLLAGHFESIFDYMDQRELDYAVEAACAYGHIDILESLISHGVDRDPNSDLRSAIVHQNLAAAKFMIARGATNYKDLFTHTDNFDFISLGLSHGGIPDTESMTFAGNKLSLGVIVLLHSFGGSYDAACIGALQTGRINIITRLIDRCDFSQELLKNFLFSECHIYFRNRKKIIDFLIARGVDTCYCGKPSIDHPLTE